MLNIATFKDSRVLFLKQGKKRIKLECPHFFTTNCSFLSFTTVLLPIIRNRSDNLVFIGGWYLFYIFTCWYYLISVEEARMMKLLIIAVFLVAVISASFPVHIFSLHLSFIFIIFVYHLSILLILLI